MLNPKPGSHSPSPIKYTDKIYLFSLQMVEN